MNVGEPHHKIFTANVSSRYATLGCDSGKSACPGEEWSPAAKGGVLEDAGWHLRTTKKIEWVVTLMLSSSQGSFLKFLSLLSEAIQNFVSRRPQSDSWEALIRGNGRGHLERSDSHAPRTEGTLSEAVPSLSPLFGTTVPERA
ncbi:hypothetical protein ACVWZR_002031 [Bradyrhizobium sp. i1.3.1]